MLSFLTDEYVWAAIREREDEARAIHPHTNDWPAIERSMLPPNPLRWLGSVFRRPADQAPQYH